MASPIMEMVFELFLIGSVGIVGLRYIFEANWTGIDTAVATLLTTVLGLMFGIVVVYNWYGRVKHKN